MGYNHGSIKGYSEADLEGGPLRFAIGASGLTSLDADADDVSGVRGELDYALKAHGFSSTGAVYLSSAQSNASFTDQSFAAVGFHAQAGYLVTKHIQLASRYALIDPDGPQNNTHVERGIHAQSVAKWLERMADDSTNHVRALRSFIAPSMVYRMPMTWDDHASGWDDDEAVRAYSAAAFDGLKLISSERGVGLAGARVLDFGCGTGLLTEKLSPVCGSIAAVDTSEEMVATLVRKIERLGLSNVWTSTAGIEDLMAEGCRELSAPFDLVVCSSVCAFLDDYPATLKALARLLRPGGLFVQWDWEIDTASDEPFGFSPEQIGDALQGADFETIEVRTAFDVVAEGKSMRPLMGVGCAPTRP